METLVIQNSMTDNTHKYVPKNSIVKAYQTKQEVILHSSDGDIIVPSGNYIITDTNGIQWSCNPEEFHEKYEKF